MAMARVARAWLGVDLCAVFIQLATNKWQIGRAIDCNNLCPYLSANFWQGNKENNETLRCFRSLRTVDDDDDDVYVVE